MNSTFLMIVHQKSSVTGRLGSKLEARGCCLDVRCPMAGHELPQDLSAYAAVAMLGGPMSANDDHLPGIRAELDWLPTVLAAGTAFLGICLGAQILARVLGAEVRTHPEGLAEIGYFPLRPTPAGSALFGDDLHVYQWHREGFELPAGSVLLAEGDCFVNQAYRYGRAYGIQFHPEVTSEMMERWLTHGAERLALPGAQPPDQHRAGRERHDAAFERWLDRFLGYWLDCAPYCPA